jgi:hypothetical protein
VSVVEATETHTGLKGDCCDAIFLRGVYHHVTRPRRRTRVFTKWCVRGSSGGHRLPVAVVPVDVLPSQRRAGEPWRTWRTPRRGHRRAPEGWFVLERRIDQWRGGLYCLVFQKPT